MPLTEEDRRERRLKQKRASRAKRMEDPAYREKMRVRSQLRRDSQTDAQKAHDKEYFKNYRQTHKAQKKETESAYYQANKEGRKNYAKEYYQDNKEKIKKYEKIRRGKTQASRSEYASVYRNDPVNRQKKKVLLKSQKDNLDDVYVRGVLTNGRLTAKDIPQSLIKVKRAYIKGMRLIKEQEDEGQKNQKHG